MKLKALVQNPKYGVKWLTIESDEDDTKGYFNLVKPNLI